MHQLLPLSNEDTFESFICDLFNELYNTRSFNKFGKKGNNQKGIDIYSYDKRSVVQCKKKDITRSKQSLKRELYNDIENDINSVISKKMKIEFDSFIFTSTYSDNTDLIEFCSELAHDKNLKYSIDYWGWETLSEKALKFPGIIKKYWRDYVFEDYSSHQNVEDMKKKKQMENDFAIWNNYKIENRKRRSRMIIKKYDSSFYPDNPFDSTINNYTWQGVEFSKIYHDGVDFFVENEIIFVNEQNEWCIECKDESYKIVTVSKIGRIAFQDIVEYDMKGDEHYLCPILLCNYRHNGTPFFKYYYRDTKNNFITYH